MSKGGESMKEGWKMVKFEDAIQKVTYTNKISSNSYKTNGCYPIVSQEKDLINGYWNNEDDLFKVQKPIIIFGDHTKVVKYIDFDFVLGADGVKILLPHDGIDSKFFYYYVSGIDLRDLGYARHYKLLKEKNIPLPPLEEQHRIVGILDAAFAKIDALKANAEANLANAKALFQQVLAQELKPKEGWVEKKLGEIYDVRDGTHDSPKYYLEGYPLVTSKNLKETGLDLSNVKYINEKDYHAINLRSKVDVGDILFAMIGTIGNPVQVTEEPNYAIKNMALFKVGQSNSSEYLKYFLLSSIERMRKEANGTTQKFVSLNYLRNFIINLPPLEEQHRIVSTLDTLSEKCRRLEQVAQQTIRECDALKQSILRQAFSGEL